MESSITQPLLLTSPNEWRRPQDLAGDHLVSVLKNEYIETSAKKRKVAQVAAIVASVSAKTTFIRVSLAGIPGAGGWFCAFCNIGAFFTLEVWAAFNMVDESLGKKTASQQEIEKKEKPNRYKTVAFVTSSFAVVVLSQITPALVVAKYNPHDKILASFVLIVASSLVPARSMQLSFKAAREISRDPLKQKLAGIRAEVAQLLGSKALTLSDAQSLIVTLASANTKEEYWQILFTGEQRAQEGESCGRKAVRLTAKTIGYGVATALQLFNANYAYTESKNQLVDNGGFAGVLAVCSFSASIYILGTAIPNTAASIATNIYDFVAGKRKPTLSEELRPKLTRLTKVFGLLVDVGAMGAVYVMWNQFYENKGLRDAAEFNNVSAYFLLLSTAMLAVTDDIIKTYIRHRGSEDEKAVVAIHQQFQKMANDLRNTPLLDFASFVLDLPETTKDALLSKYDVTLEQLQELLPARVEEVA